MSSVTTAFYSVLKSPFVFSIHIVVKGEAKKSGECPNIIVFLPRSKPSDPYASTFVTLNEVSLGGAYTPVL